MDVASGRSCLMPDRGRCAQTTGDALEMAILYASPRASRCVLNDRASPIGMPEQDYLRQTD
jgi:hypothetical protein